MGENVYSDTSYDKLLNIINNIRETVRKSNTFKELCKEHDVDPSFIDLVPMCFANLDVSARTDNGIIYFNYNLLNDSESIEHYMVHELTHFLQQCFGDGPTTGSSGSSADDYLDNEFEQESFQNQTEYIEETDGESAADRYVKRVLDHHNVPLKERKKRRKQLRGFIDDIVRIVTS